jgi:nitrite reductase/ring-hydroxylating ferredoxin subunit
MSLLLHCILQLTTAACRNYAKEFALTTGELIRPEREFMMSRVSD